MVLPLGVEPRSSVPETNVLSIAPQELILLKFQRLEQNLLKDSIDALQASFVNS